MWTSHTLKVRPHWLQIFCFFGFTIFSVTSAPFYYFASHPEIIPVQHQTFYLVQSPHYVYQHQDVQAVQSYENRQADDSSELPVVYQKEYVSREETIIPPQPNVKPPRGPVRIFFLFSRFPWPIEPFIQRVQNYFSTYTVPTQEPLLAEEIDIAPDPGYDELEPDIGPPRPAPPEEPEKVTTEIIETSPEINISTTETPITTFNYPVTTVKTTFTNDDVPVTTLQTPETTANIIKPPGTTEFPSSKLSSQSNSVIIRTNKLKFPVIFPNHPFII